MHKIDLISWLTGQRIVRASALTRTLDKKYPDGTPISVDDNAWCCFEFENGAMGTLFASWTNYGQEENWTSVYGTKFRDREHTVVLEKASETEYYDLGGIQTNDNQTSTGIIDMFVSAIEKDTPYISAEEVLNVMKAVFACAESAEQNGKEVEVDA